VSHISRIRPTGSATDAAPFHSAAECSRRLQPHVGGPWTAKAFRGGSHQLDHRGCRSENRQSIAQSGRRKACPVRFAPEFNQLYATRGQSVYVYDGTTLGQIAKVNLENRLDEIQYDPKAKRLYAGVMADKTAIAILNIPDAKQLGEIELPGKPQGFIIEQKGERISANIPALKQIAVMDRKSRTLLEPWPLAGTEGNYPIDLDEDRHWLFVSCRQPPRMIVFDTGTGKPVATIDISGDTDDLFYDAAGKRVYVSSGDGSIDVIEQRDGDHYHSLLRIPIVLGARTSNAVRCAEPLLPRSSQTCEPAGRDPGVHGEFLRCDEIKDLRGFVRACATRSSCPRSPPRLPGSAPPMAER
jgi:hypothetical protein